MIGLAAIALALGIVYWLLRERDDRLEQAQEKCKLENAPDECSRLSGG